VAAYRVSECALFLVQGGVRTAVLIPPCTGGGAYTDTWCCHITHNNGILMVLIRDFGWEPYALPDDGVRCAVEACRSSEGVLV
jgi:hypothetical protein